MQTFVLVLLLTMPSGDVEEFAIDSELSLSECKASGLRFEQDNGGLSWECVPASDE